MSVEDIFDEIFKKAEYINDCWNNNGVSSKGVRKETEYNFFHNKNIKFADKCAYFYALENRIKQRYNGIFKILFRYFSWKKETKLLGRIKQFFSFPDNSDAKRIILEKSEEFLNGQDCFGGNNNKNGLKLQSTEQENKQEKEQENKQEKSEEKTDDGKEKNSDEIKKDFKDKTVADNKQGAEKDNATNLKQADANPTKTDTNGSPLNENEKTFNEKPTETAKKTDQTDLLKQNVATREKLEIPKSDLLNFSKVKTTKFAENLKKENSENKINSKQFADNNAMQKNNDFVLLQENFSQTKKQDDFIPQYELLNKSNTNSDINSKQVNFIRTEDAIKGNYDKNSLSDSVKNYQISERQKNEIIGAEISKISEEDLQSIKDFMQEEINRQMDVAEERGEVYKMPISIKEVIPPESSEKSQAQVNDNADDSVVMGNSK